MKTPNFPNEWGICKQKGEFSMFVHPTQTKPNHRKWWDITNK